MTEQDTELSPLAELADIFLEHLIPEVKVPLFRFASQAARLTEPEKAAVLQILVHANEHMAEVIPVEVAGRCHLLFSRIDELLMAIHLTADVNPKDVTG